MSGWLGVAAVVCLAVLPAHVSAQTIQVAPFGGYRVGGDFFERATGQPVDLDGAPVVGGTLNVAMYDGLWFEGLFTHQEARVTTVDPRLMTTTRWRVTVDHWLAGGLQEFGGDRARPFLTGLLGLTRYAAEGNETRFVVSAGGGVKLHPTRRVGVRLDGRVFATFADIDGRAIACSSGGCIVAVDADVVWQGEASVGVVIAF